MKKVLTLLFATFLVVALAGCGVAQTSTSDSNQESKVTSEKKKNKKKNKKNKKKKAKNNDENKSSSQDVEWRKFLKEYEDWVDDYVAMMKKYKENPTDMSILSDYTEMVSEMADWTSKADEIELSIVDTNDALEYSSELLRIAGKLAKVVN